MFQKVLIVLSVLYTLINLKWSENMKGIMKKMLLLILISTAILTVSALADQTKGTYGGKYPSEKCCPSVSCDKCNCNGGCRSLDGLYNASVLDNQYSGKCIVTCCDYEFCSKCGEKHYADGYCDKCGEKCSLSKYCPNDKKFYPYDGNHYCPKCGDFCCYVEHCDKCGYTHYFNGYCDNCGMKCYLGQCCYMKCVDKCKEPCQNCYETPVKEVTPTYNENANYDMGTTTGYPTKSASDNTPSYNTQGETTQPAQQTY
jgi:hypothetical protein